MGKKFFISLSLLIGLILAVWAPAYFFYGIDPVYVSGVIRAKFNKPADKITFKTPSDKAVNISLKGFKTNTFADNLGKITSIAFDQNFLYVTNKEGAVIRLADRNGDGVSDGRRNFTTGLNNPSGLAFSSNFIFVSQKGKVTAFFDEDLNGQADSQDDILIALPSGKFQTNSITLGPDGKLYIAQGATSDKAEFGVKRWEASILRINLDGSGIETFATGLRNTTDIAFSPTTKELFGVEDGQDFPSFGVPDELNLIARKGDYGWPGCWGNNQGTSCKDTDIQPVALLTEHAGPTGLAFYTGNQFPSSYKNNLFVALYGSPSNDPKTGKKILRVILNKDQNGYQAKIEDFATGFARPIDIAVGPEGSVYVADQTKGNIIRISAHYN